VGCAFSRAERYADESGKFNEIKRFLHTLKIHFTDLALDNIGLQEYNTYTVSESANCHNGN